MLHYYTLAGHLIGAFDGANTTFYLIDALGSVLMSFSQSAILGEQIYGPYGNQRYGHDQHCQRLYQADPASRAILPFHPLAFCYDLKYDGVAIQADFCCARSKKKAV